MALLPKDRDDRKMIKYAVEVLKKAALLESRVAKVVLKELADMLAEHLHIVRSKKPRLRLVLDVAFKGGDAKALRAELAMLADKMTHEGNMANGSARVQELAMRVSAMVES